VGLREKDLVRDAARSGRVRAAQNTNKKQFRDKVVKNSPAGVCWGGGGERPGQRRSDRVPEMLGKLTT